jgi:AcrR family transcriptional regulator
VTRVENPNISTESAAALQGDAAGQSPRDRSRRRSATSGESRPAARGQIVDAAIATILELGFYRASSNEIARKANVSWGSIQYHFGTREGLLLAVVEELNERFTKTMKQAQVSGNTLEERLHSLYGILAAHYGAPTYLARLQIVLNLSHDPDTSADVADALVRQADVAGEDLRRLLHGTLGDDASPATMNAIFNAIRGTALSCQITDTLSGRNPEPHVTTIDPTELSVLLAGLAATARLDSGTNG